MLQKLTKREVPADYSQRKDPDPKLFYPPVNYRIELQRSR